MGWEGAPLSERISPAVFLDLDYGTISYEWLGRIMIKSGGIHKFILDSRGYAGLYIDNKPVLETTGSEKGVNPVSAEIFLSPGSHAIRARYSQEKMFAKMELRWVPPGGTEGLVPVDVLFH
jgi:hypothetical protein